MAATTQHSPADAMECLRAIGADKRGVLWQTALFWRGITTQTEYRHATGILGETEFAAALADLDRTVTEWLEA